MSKRALKSTVALLAGLLFTTAVLVLLRALNAKVAYFVAAGAAATSRICIIGSRERRDSTLRVCEAGKQPLEYRRLGFCSVLVEMLKKDVPIHRDI